MRISSHQILIDDRADLVFGGEFQYFRIQRDQWEGLLTSFKEAGVNLISAYVPWIWHEVREGEFDFDGRTAPERDLRGFLYLCRRLELPVIIKPGPYIYAEYQGFGIPFWLRERYPETLMRPPLLPDHPEVFLNHPRFLELTRRWFDALAPLLAPMIAAGEIVALQLDNETGMPQYGAGPYLTDLNPESVRQLRQYLAGRYADIQALNEAWGTKHVDFEHLVPPSSAPTTRSQLVDLARYVEDTVVGYLGTLKGFWQELGIDTHFYLNDVWFPSWPNHFAKKNRVAPVGFDLYPKFIRVSTPLDQPYAISFVPKMYRAMLRGGPLMAPEIGAGWMDVGVKVPVIATLQKMMASYLRGSQCNILYPLHEGQDPDGSKYLYRSPFNHKGERSERMAVVEALGQFRKDWGRLLADSEEVSSPVGILYYQDATHDILQYTCDPVKVARENLDDAIDRGVTHFPANAGLYGALVEGGYQPRVLELDTATPSELSACKVLFFNCTGHLAPELVSKLEAYVEAGGSLVTLGTPFVEGDHRLFPGRLKRTWRPRALAVVTGTVGDLTWFHLRDRHKIAHPIVRFTLEKLQPVMGMIKHATRAGVWLTDSLYGGKVWCARMVSYVTVPPGGTELLNYMKAPVGYMAPVGAGTSAFVGTLLGPILDSPGYYLDDPARKQSVVSFVSSLLVQLGVKPLTRPLLGLEPVLRRTPEGTLLALINRGEARDFTMSLPEGYQADRITQQFSYLGSKATWDAHLSGHMMGGDVLLLHLADA
ncbi:MAG TPA: alpha-amylase family protein [Pantanalinema sp.]